MKVLNTKPKRKGVGRPKQKETLKRELLEKYRSKFINNGKLVSSTAQIYIAMSKLLKVKDSQTIYLHASGYFEKQRPPENYRSDDGVYENSGDYDQTYTLHIENDDLISKFIETNAYIRGLCSYLRFIIWEFTKYSCD